jgi:hypothetical protein
LYDLVDLLSAGEHHDWTAWLSTARRRIAGGDRRGLDHLLQAYGGRGSFNDVQVADGDDSCRR